MVIKKTYAAPPLVVVAAALIDDAGRVLVQQRAAGKSHAGLWEFPGGKVEPGEAPAEALVRELAEELGIRVATDALIPLTFAADARVALLLFTCDDWEGEPRALDAVALRWDVPEALATLPMPPLDIPLLRALADKKRPERTPAV